MNRVLRFFCGLVLAVAMVFSMVSCASSKAVPGRDDSPFAEQFASFGATVRVKDGNLALQTDVILPPGASIVLDTNEIWVLNLNGHSIIQKACDGAPAIDIVSGTLGVVNGNANANLGGIACDGVCILVRSGSALQIDAGTFTGASYAVEVQSGGYIKVSGGRIQASVLPLLVHEGWGGNLIGGMFSSYDRAYDQAILGRNYACIRFGAFDSDFISLWPSAFTIAQKSEYGGTSGLKLSTTGGLLARFRLYRTHLTDSLIEAEDVQPAYEWTMYPGQVTEVYFDSGSYVLKVAEGYDWSDTSGFGAEGIYWSMPPFVFENGRVYSISTNEGKRNYEPDTLSGFLTGR